MLKLSLKIWCVANLMVAIVFIIGLFRSGIAGLFKIQLFSCLLSLPAVIILYLALYFLKQVHGRALFCWAVMVLATAAAAFAAFYLFGLLFKELTADFNFILPLSFLTAYCALLLYSPSLHYLFIKFYYERENSAG